MSKIFSNRNMIIIGVIIAVILAWYFFFSGSAPSTTDLLQSSPAQSESDQLLSELNQIKSLTLDADIFSSPAFMSLTDSSVTLATQPSGRSNPFGPLPNFAPAASPLTAVTTSK